MPLAPGTRLGPYEISSPVGAGGMGEVHRRSMRGWSEPSRPCVAASAIKVESAYVLRAGGPVIVSKSEYSPKSSSVYTSLKHVATSSLRGPSCVKSVSSNCMEDPKPKKASPEAAGVDGPAGLRAPAKGDSSGSDFPREEKAAKSAGKPSHRPSIRMPARQAM